MFPGDFSPFSTYFYCNINSATKLVYARALDHPVALTVKAPKALGIMTCDSTLASKICFALPFLVDLTGAKYH